MNKTIKCKKCGVQFEKRLLSRKGYCRICATKRMSAAGYQLKVKEGEFYEKWKTNWEKGIKSYFKGKKVG